MPSCLSLDLQDVKAADAKPEQGLEAKVGELSRIPQNSSLTTCTEQARLKSLRRRRRSPRSCLSAFLPPNEAV